jgi:hypothetical protein
LVATVEQVSDGMPTVVRFTSELDLDNPAITLLIQEHAGLLPRRFPPVGQSMTFAPANFPLGLLSDHHY